MPQLPDKKEGSGTYTFQYVHPQTSCPKSGDVQTRTFLTETRHYALVLAENERVLCNTCGHDYKLTK